MMVDSEDNMVVESAQNDRDQVAIIEPELDNETETPENVTLATDCMFLSRIHASAPLRL